MHYLGRMIINRSKCHLNLDNRRSIHHSISICLFETFSLLFKKPFHSFKRTKSDKFLKISKPWFNFIYFAQFQSFITLRHIGASLYDAFYGHNCPYILFKVKKFWAHFCIINIFSFLFADRCLLTQLHLVFPKILKIVVFV